MHLPSSIAAFALALSSSLAWAADSPVGYWKTIDDDSGHPKSVVQLWQNDAGLVYGKIVKLYREPGEEADPLCDKCEGADHNKRTIGMTILKGLKDDGDAWSGGTIMDPGNG